MDIRTLYDLFLRHPSVETDTRKLQEGDIFFALKGPNFNGNHYLQQALSAGAAYCIADEISDIKNDRIIKVSDSLHTLQQLAKMHREQFDIPFIAITGSNGKTTTKELVSQVLSTEYITYTTFGNLNNHIGIPLTLLKIKKNAQMAVIEMGANHLKEIESYCEYTQPTHSIITNCGKAHLEGFGGEEGVRKGKGELFDFTRKHGGTAFVNMDYDYMKLMSQGIKSLTTYGKKEGDITGMVISDENFLEISITKGAELNSIKTQLVGGYNLPNILIAISVGKLFNIKDNNIKKALENYLPSNSRSQLLQVDSNKIILDAYNANPSSMIAAIKNFASMHGDKKILLLGGMMELGAESINEHTAIVKLILQYQWYKVVLVGKDYINLPGTFIHFNNVAEASAWFNLQKFKETLILIKGSRSMAMEKVLD